MQEQEPPDHTLAALRAFPGTVWTLLAGTFLNKFGTFVVPFLAIYLTRQGYTTGECGAAISAYGIGQLLACGFGGHLADTLGRRKTIVLSMFSGGAAMLMLSQARGLPAVLAFAALAGLTGELYRPASSALLTDLIPARHRVTAFAAYRLSFNAGWAFGPATAGFLAAYSFFWLFLGDALTSLLYGVVAWRCLPEVPPLRREEEGWLSAWRVIRRDRRFLRAMIASLAIALVFLQMASTYGLHVTALGFSQKTYGLLLSLNGVLIVCCELPLTEITRRFPARLVMALGYLLIGLGFVLNAFCTHVWQLAGGMMLFTTGEMITIPVFSAHIADLAPAHLRGRYMGTWGLIGALALILGPNLGMTLYRSHPPAYWTVCGMLSVFAAVVIATGKPVNSS